MDFLKLPNAARREIWLENPAQPCTTLLVLSIAFYSSVGLYIAFLGSAHQMSKVTSSRVGQRQKPHLSPNYKGTQTLTGPVPQPTGAWLSLGEPVAQTARKFPSNFPGTAASWHELPGIFITQFCPLGAFCGQNDYQNYTQLRK